MNWLDASQVAWGSGYRRAFQQIRETGRHHDISDQGVIKKLRWRR